MAPLSHGGDMYKTKTVTRLCTCTGNRTRDRCTPQQCRRCGNRIDRQYDDEIGATAPVSIVIDLPDDDWEMPFAK